MSDMSYQSDISGFSKVYLTATRQEKKLRPHSAKKEDNLEPIIEGPVQFRCPSPQFDRSEPLTSEHNDAKFETRLDVYLEETQQYLDYLNELETQIKDQRDLKEIDYMKEIMGKAVEQHVGMCDTLVADLVDGLLEAEESI